MLVRCGVANKFARKSGYRRSFGKTLLSPSGLPGFGIGRNIMANLCAKAAECTGWPPLTANPPYPEGRNINWNDRLKPIAPFSNTIWSLGWFEGNCTRLGDGWHESRFAVTRKSRHACRSEPMHAEHGDVGRRRARSKTQTDPGSSGQDCGPARELDQA